jgi:hypothetical protein
MATSRNHVFFESVSLLDAIQVTGHPYIKDIQQVEVP